MEFSSRIDWLTDRFVDGLIDWLIEWLMCWLTGMLAIKASTLSFHISFSSMISNNQTDLSFRMLITEAPSIPFIDPPQDESHSLCSTRISTRKLRINRSTVIMSRVNESRTFLYFRKILDRKFQGNEVLKLNFEEAKFVWNATRESILMKRSGDTQVKLVRIDSQVLMTNLSDGRPYAIAVPVRHFRRFQRMIKRLLTNECKCSK
jgi:hypothetical protein